MIFYICDLQIIEYNIVEVWIYLSSLNTPIKMTQKCENYKYRMFNKISFPLYKKSNKLIQSSDDFKKLKQTINR